MQTKIEKKRDFIHKLVGIVNSAYFSGGEISELIDRHIKRMEFLAAKEAKEKLENKIKPTFLTLKSADYQLANKDGKAYQMDDESSSKENTVIVSQKTKLKKLRLTSHKPNLLEHKKTGESSEETKENETEINKDNAKRWICWL